MNDLIEPNAWQDRRSFPWLETLNGSLKVAMGERMSPFGDKAVARLRGI